MHAMFGPTALVLGVAIAYPATAWGPGGFLGVGSQVATAAATTTEGNAEEVGELVKALMSKVQKCHQGFDAPAVGNVLYGLRQRLGSDEVRELLKVLAPQVRECAEGSAEEAGAASALGDVSFVGGPAGGAQAVSASALADMQPQQGRVEENGHEEQKIHVGVDDEKMPDERQHRRRHYDVEPHGTQAYGSRPGVEHARQPLVSQRPLAHSVAEEALKADKQPPALLQNAPFPRLVEQRQPPPQQRSMNDSGAWQDDKSSRASWPSAPREAPSRYYEQHGYSAGREAQQLVVRGYGNPQPYLSRQRNDPAHGFHQDYQKAPRRFVEHMGVGQQPHPPTAPPPQHLEPQPQEWRGWTRHWHAAANKWYYFHRPTGHSQYEYPTEAMQVEIAAQQAMQADMDAQRWGNGPPYYSNSQQQASGDSQMLASQLQPQDLDFAGLSTKVNQSQKDLNNWTKSFLDFNANLKQKMGGAQKQMDLCLQGLKKVQQEIVNLLQETETIKAKFREIKDSASRATDIAKNNDKADLVQEKLNALTNLCDINENDTKNLSEKVSEITETRKQFVQHKLAKMMESIGKIALEHGRLNARLEDVEGSQQEHRLLKARVATLEKRIESLKKPSPETINQDGSSEAKLKSNGSHPLESPLRLSGKVPDGQAAVERGASGSFSSESSSHASDDGSENDLSKVK